MRFRGGVQNYGSSGSQDRRHQDILGGSDAGLVEQEVRAAERTRTPQAEGVLLPGHGNPELGQAFEMGIQAAAANDIATRRIEGGGAVPGC